MSLDHIDDTVVAQAPSVQAAEYVRMSTEHQQYSTENQRDGIREYAVRRGLEIVRTYADEGKSGLRIDGRQALQQLIKDVESGRADFQVILVYDVSRWGRFQDADESAYYEYVCRRVGIQVAYCAEQFENDGSPVSTIVKGVKRAMAGEYSRELSAKVFAGQCRLIELGFRQGGPAGYGLRRVLIDQHGIMKGELQRGEHKSLQTDRVILMPGPESEVRIINLIYNWFIDGSLNEYEIAARLNGMRVRTHLDREWTRATVREVLTNEKYIGNNVYNRVSFKLKKMRVVNTPDMWIRKEGAFQSIVPGETFYTAQGIMRARARRYSNEELIQRLRNLYRDRGFLSGLVIDETDGMPSSSVYMLTVNHEFTTCLVLARCQTHENGRHRWKVRFDTSLLPDITVAVRLDHANSAALDYYLLPRLDFGQPRISLADQNRIEFESYRFDTLDYLYGMGERARLRRVA